MVRAKLSPNRAWSQCLLCLFGVSSAGSWGLAHSRHPLRRRSALLAGPRPRISLLLQPGSSAHAFERSFIPSFCVTSKQGPPLDWSPRRPAGRGCSSVNVCQGSDRVSRWSEHKCRVGSGVHPALRQLVVRQTETSGGDRGLSMEGRGRPGSSRECHPGGRAQSREYVWLWEWTQPTCPPRPAAP